jgi:hypothetical protein
MSTWQRGRWSSYTSVTWWTRLRSQILRRMSLSIRVTLHVCSYMSHSEHLQFTNKHYQNFLSNLCISHFPHTFFREGLQATRSCVAAAGMRGSLMVQRFCESVYSRLPPRWSLMRMPLSYPSPPIREDLQATRSSDEVGKVSRPPYRSTRSQRENRLQEQGEALTLPSRSHNDR